jgi:hypothetical protein
METLGSHLCKGQTREALTLDEAILSNNIEVLGHRGSLAGGFPGPGLGQTLIPTRNGSGFHRIQRSFGVGKPKPRQLVL